MNSIEQLSPKSVWELFYQITQVPRPSKKEGKILQFLKDFAESRNLKYNVDEIGNIVIYKEAQNGGSNTPVILQSHIDMVCEKDAAVEIDFEKDPITPYIDGGWVRAKGTTLGADCGIGMACELALLDSTDLRHPALEALFTVDEETGLTGAFGLGKDILSGTELINLDSEDEGEVFIGCAGGVDTLAYWTEQRTTTPASHKAALKLSVSGLLGGHSGDDINKGLANSNRLLLDFLLANYAKFDMRIATIDGGNLRNAIPREAWCIITLPETALEGVKNAFAAEESRVKTLYVATEPSIQFLIEAAELPETVLESSLALNVLRAITELPNGVIAMSKAIEGLVETSTNLASVKMREGKIVVATSQRSSDEASKNSIAKEIEQVFTANGAIVLHSEGYPGWIPRPDTAIVRRFADSYRKLFGCDAKIKAIHAGLECGLFLDKYPKLEMVSVGPTLRGVHSPSERLEIESVEKFWRLLTDVISSY